MNLRLISALFLLGSVQSGFSSREYYPQCDNTCYVDPCRGRECPANTGAKCVSRCCRAYFYDKYGNDITSRCDCPSGVKPHRCKPDPCDTAACVKAGECRTDRCGGCDPVFYDRNAKAISGCPIEHPNGAVCPPLPKGTLGKCEESCGDGCQRPKLCCSNGCGHECKRPYYLDCPQGAALACKPPACWVRKCARQLQATCRATCSGCIPHFFDQFDNEVTDKCRCSSGEVSVECVNDPCKTATCPNRPDAVCRTNTCGKCEAIFYDKRGNEVQCKKPEPQCPPVPKGSLGICVDECGRDGDCPRNKKCCSNGCGRICRSPLPADCDAIRCFANACHVQTCHTHTQAKCRAVCSTCFAFFTNKFGIDITEKCNCDKGVSVKQCSDDLCKGKTCRGHQEAECRINSCGKCSVAFFDKFGKEVKCDEKYDQRCPAVRTFRRQSTGTCSHRCSSNRDCPSKQICCSNGCGSLCMFPPQDERCPPPDPKIIEMLPRMFCITTECVENSDCKKNDICCSDGCSRKCISAPFLDPRCEGEMDDFGPCINLCNSNQDCGRKEMCCRVGCGTACIPEARRPKYDERCPPPPAPVSERSCPKMCSKNSNCRSDYMCCPLNCGTHCTRKPKSCEPGEFIAKCRNVCKGRSCSNHPGAKCRVHGCNGCKAEFYDRNNRLLNDCLDEYD